MDEADEMVRTVRTLLQQVARKIPARTSLYFI
jgi:hypothetical protein